MGFGLNSARTPDVMKKSCVLSALVEGAVAWRLLALLVATVPWEDIPNRRSRFIGEVRDLRSLYLVATEVHLRIGHWPETVRHLLDEQGDFCQIEKEPRDAWGNPFHFIASDGNFFVACFGRDNQLGGEGEAADRFWPPGKQ